jgi:hypothetical protein
VEKSGGPNTPNIWDASTPTRARRIQSSRFNGEIDENIKSGMIRFF